MKKILNWELIDMTKAEIDQIEKERIEYEKFEEKRLLISQYKEKQSQIQNLKWEIQDIEDTLEEKSDQWKILAGMRKKVLEERLVKVREESDGIALAGIDKFWTGIIWEF